MTAYPERELLLVCTEDGYRTTLRCERLRFDDAAPRSVLRVTVESESSALSIDLSRAACRALARELMRAATGRQR